MKEDSGCHVPVRSCVITAIALLLPIGATGASAAPLKPAQKHAMAEKYSDRSAKPAHGRAGTAQLSARALLDRDGRARIELSTGDFDGGSATGTLEKVQVKVFAGDKLAATDNYSPLGSATASIDYASLARGQRVALQANVKGSGRGRTEVVSLDTTVMRRPDVAAVELAVPDQVPSRSTRPVTAVIEERNGDVGARFNCQLFVNDVPQATIAGAWVDAGSRVACRFMVNFAAAGEARVSVRVSGMAPTDDDAANDVATAIVDVVAQPFDSAQANWYWSRTEGAYQYWQFFRNFGNDWDRFSDPAPYAYSYQQFGASARMNSAHPAAGTLRLRHSMDGRALPDVQVDMSQLVANDWGCMSGYFEGGVSAYVCTGPDYFDASAYVDGNIAIYYPDGWYAGEPWFLDGDKYSVEISVDGPTLQRSSAMTVQVPPPVRVGFDWTSWRCTTYMDPWGYTYSGDCDRRWEVTTYRQGFEATT